MRHLWTQLENSVMVHLVWRKYSTSKDSRKAKLWSRLNFANTSVHTCTRWSLANWLFRDYIKANRLFTIAVLTDIQPVVVLDLNWNSLIDFVLSAFLTGQYNKYCDYRMANILKILKCAIVLLIADSAMVNFRVLARAMSTVVKTFEANGVVPDVIPQAPADLATVSIFYLSIFLISEGYRGWPLLSSKTKYF